MITLCNNNSSCKTKINRLFCCSYLSRFSFQTNKQLLPLYLFRDRKIESGKVGLVSLLVKNCKFHQTAHLTLRKIAIWMSKNFPKLDIFFKKYHFFKKITIGNFVEKMTIFVNFFWKNVKFLAFFWKMSSFWQFFDSQMAIFRRVSIKLVI